MFVQRPHWYCHVALDRNEMVHPFAWIGCEQIAPPVRMTASRAGSYAIKGLSTYFGAPTDVLRFTQLGTSVAEGRTDPSAANSAGVGGPRSVLAGVASIASVDFPFGMGARIEAVSKELASKTPTTSNEPNTAQVMGRRGGRTARPHPLVRAKRPGFEAVPGQLTGPTAPHTKSLSTGRDRAVPRV